MSDDGYTTHDMETNERLARVEGKIDYVIKNLDEQRSSTKAQWNKIDDQGSRITTLEAERRVYWKIVTPILSLVSGFLGGLIVAFKN